MSAPRATANAHEDGHDDPYDDAHEDSYQDGNALAGPLAEIFAVDLTAALGTCTACQTVGPLARLRVYHHAPGLVARCPSCGHVILRLVRSPESACLDLRGTLNLRIPLPPES
jgi:hypothetical protein